jgi:hypothetical protein
VPRQRAQRLQLRGDADLHPAHALAALLLRGAILPHVEDRQRRQAGRTDARPAHVERATGRNGDEVADAGEGDGHVLRDDPVGVDLDRPRRARQALFDGDAHGGQAEHALDSPVEPRAA